MSAPKTFSKDPTCGISVDEATAQHRDRDGKTYYFCSDPCQRQFEALSAGESRTCYGEGIANIPALVLASGS